MKRHRRPRESRQSPQIKTPAQLARAIGVARSSVTRWMKRDDWFFTFPVDAGDVVAWRKHGRTGAGPHAAEIAELDAEIKRLQREEREKRIAKLDAETAGLLQRNAIKADGSVPASVHEDVIAKLADLVVNAVHDLVEPLPALLNGESPERMRAIVQRRFEGFLQRMAAVKSVPATPADGNGHDRKRLDQPAAKRAAAKRHKTRGPKT